jgi:VanZ family protein
MTDGPPRSSLPYALAALYVLAIAYASLQPLSEWIAPPPGTPLWIVAPWSARWTRFDVAANVLAYFPLGLFVALAPRSARFGPRVGFAFLVGAMLSFAMESLQTLIPVREASVVDFASNGAGAALGGIVGAALAANETRRVWLSTARARMFLPGALGDVGLALLALWLVAQTNPAIPLFALSFESDLTQQPLGPDHADLAGVLIEAASSGFQLLGIGLFVALILRDRRYAGGAVLALIGLALVSKGVSATLLLKPAVWETWLRPGVLLGVAAGALLLLFAIFLPRAAQVTLCAVALLSSLMTPMLAPDLMTTRAPLSIFNWRYGHLLNFNGLTHAVLLAWPVAASAWLFALAGRPSWGDPG